MLAYFTASIAGKKYFRNYYQKIVDLLKKKGHSVLSEHILDIDQSSIRMETKEERLAFHEQLDKWISSSNCMIAEISYPSISVGYEISLALNYNKPILLLYTAGNPPSLLLHHKDERLICEQYTLNNLKSIIDHFLNYAQDQDEQRFTFYITSQIASFLDKISKEEKLPKAVFLRKLIEKEITKHH